MASSGAPSRPLGRDGANRCWWWTRSVLAIYVCSGCSARAHLVLPAVVVRIGGAGHLDVSTTLGLWWGTTHAHSSIQCVGCLVTHVMRWDNMYMWYVRDMMWCTGDVMSLWSWERTGVHLLLYRSRRSNTSDVMWDDIVFIFFKILLWKYIGFRQNTCVNLYHRIISKIS